MDENYSHLKDFKIGNTMINGLFFGCDASAAPASLGYRQPAPTWVGIKNAEHAAKLPLHSHRPPEMKP